MIYKIIKICARTENIVRVLPAEYDNSEIVDAVCMVLNNSSLAQEPYIYMVREYKDVKELNTASNYDA